MRRKVIKQGKGTLTVTLPKKWTDEVKLKGGDEVEVESYGNNVRVSSAKAAAPEKKEISIEGIESSAARIISALYKRGYDEVDIVFSERNAVKKIQDEIKNHLMTFEIIDQRGKSISVKSLATENYGDFESILRKSFQVGLSLGKTSLEHVKNGEFEELNDLLELEKANNRFTSFCHRVISKKRYNNPGNEAFMYTIIWQLEKVVDNYKLIVQYISEKKKKPSREIMQLYREVNNFFDTFYQIFYKYDAKKLDAFAKTRKSLINKCNTLLQDKKVDHRIIYYMLNIIGDVFDLTGPFYALKL